MAIDFSKIWASASPLTPYEFSESEYTEGWNFIGVTPPSRQMWDFLQKNNDEKMKYLANNYLPLSGGTMTGAIVGDPLTLTADDGNGNTASLVINANGDIIGVTPAAGDNSTKLSTTAFVQALATILMPTGCVQAFAGSATPDGWLFCDGSAVSRTDYADLYAVIGDTYGDGDGSTTFNLPNLIDKFVQGNATSGTEHSAGLPNIEGYWRGGLLNTTGSAIADGAFRTTDGSTYADTQNMTTRVDGFEFDASLSNSIYGNSNTVQPPSVTMRYIIKY